VVIIRVFSFTLMLLALDDKGHKPESPKIKNIFSHNSNSETSPFSVNPKLDKLG
jgi:hypothetical protein